MLIHKLLFWIYSGVLNTEVSFQGVGIVPLYITMYNSYKL